MNISYLRLSRKAALVAVFSIITVLMGGLFVSQAHATASTITNITPSGSTSIEKGDVIITWVYTGDAPASDKVDIYYTNNSGTEIKLTTSDVLASNDTYTWDTVAATIPDSTNYKVKVKSTGNDVSGISATAFTIDNTAPVFSNITFPDTSSPAKTDTANVTVTDPTSGLKTDTLLYGFSATTGNCSSITYDSNNTFTSGNDITIADNHTNYLCVEATDNAGNTGYAQVGQLNTDNTPPTLTATTPYTLNSNEADVYFNDSGSASVAIALNANEPVKLSTLKIQNASDSNIYKTHSPNASTYASTVTQNWNGDLSPNGSGKAPEGTYVLYYTIKDKAGNVTGPLTGPLTSYKIIVDNTAPTMSSVVGKTIQGAGDTIVVTFGEPVVPADGDWTNGGELTFKSPTGTSVDLTGATYVFDSSANTLTVTLGSSNTVNDHLKTGDTVKAIPVLGAIIDRAGNALTASQTSATIAGDTSNPTVALTYSPNRPVKNGDTVAITATFSEAMESAPQIAIDVQGTTGDLSATAMAPTTGNQKVWTYNWTVPTGSDGSAAITITGKDLAGNTITDSSNTRTIDNTVPMITAVPSTSPITSPVADMVYRTTSLLSFTPTDSATAVSCEYSLDGGTTEIQITPCTSSTAITNATVSGLQDGRNSIEVTVTDAAGNSVTSTPVSFVYDTNGTLTVGATGADFTKIQDAINARVNGITTVQVAAGTYTGDVTVNKSLQIIGSKKNIETSSRTASGTNESTIKGLVKIEANNVSVNGFTITNPTGGYGLEVVESSPSITGADIEYNLFNDISGTSYVKGIYLIHGPDSVTIAHNAFSNISGGGHGADGIFVGDSDTTDPSTGIIISNNTFDTITSGHGTYGVLVNDGAGTGISITGNTFSNLNGGWTHAIGLEGPTPNTSVTGNTFSNLTTVSANPDNFSVFFQDNPDGGNVTITGNKFDGLATAFGGVGIHPDDLAAYGYTVTAENNWWGNATGPFDGPLAGNKNPNGLGAYVTKNVNFNPFYNSSTDMIPSNLVSSGPIKSFALSFDQNPQGLNAASTLTVTAKDALNGGGYTVVNDTSTPVSLSVVSGTATLQDLTLTMGMLGATTTTIASNVAGTAGVRAWNPNDASVYGTGTITFHALPIVIDNEFAVPSSNTADGTYVHGWHYRYEITVNAPVNNLSVEFADWNQSGSGNGVVHANGNMRLLFNSATGSEIGSSVGTFPNSDVENGFGPVKSYKIGNDYTDQKLSGQNATTPIDISGIDADSSKPGRQIWFDVYTKLPLNTPAGFYSTTYGIQVI